MSDFLNFVSEFDHSVQLAESPVLESEGFTLVTSFKNEPDHKVLLVRDSYGVQWILKIAGGYRKKTLEREYITLGRLTGGCFPHPARLFEHDGQSYFLREYVPGKMLSSFAEERELLPEEVAMWGLKVCESVSLLHRQNPPVIHRDIKPQNFIVTPDDRLVLIDFDAAQDHDPIKSEDTVVIGTAATAAPEQFGAKRSDIRADVYGIGMLILYLITNDFNIERLPATPGWLARIIRRCTSFDPEHRYQSVNKLEKALHSGLNRKRRFRVGVLLSFMATLMLIASLYIADSRNRAYKSELVVFSEPLIEAAAAHQLGKEPGTISVFDLRGLRSLFICGDLPFDNWEDVICNELDSNYYKGLPYKGAGNIVSLSDLAMMPNLTELALYSQNISDISILKELSLTRLSLSNNPVGDLTALSGMKSLQELDIIGTRVANPSVLSDCESLTDLGIADTLVYDLTPLFGLPIESLTIKYDNIYKDSTVLGKFPRLTMLEISGLPAADVMAVGKLSRLQVLSMSSDVGYPLSTLDALRSLSELRSLTLTYCPLNTLEGAERFSQLAMLSINGDDIQDLSPLFGLRNLKHLCIADVPLEDYNQLTKLPALKRVDVSDWQVEDIKKANPALEIFVVDTASQNMMDKPVQIRELLERFEEQGIQNEVVFDDIKREVYLTKDSLKATIYLPLMGETTATITCGDKKAEITLVITAGRTYCNEADVRNALIEVGFLQ